MADTFPTTGDALTAEWVTETLHGTGALPDGSRISNIDRAGVEEQGQTGEVFRLTLTYEGDAGDAPASLVAKVAPPFEEIRQQMHALGLYEREVRFYQNFATEVGLPVPRPYFADINSETGDFLLLLEDMSDCRNGDFWVSAIDDVRQAVDAAAVMHAKWWCSPRLGEAKWLQQHDDVAYNETMLAAVLRGTLPVVQQKYPEQFSGYLLETTQKLADKWESFFHYDEGDPFTLIHGDYHPKQMFFPTDKGGRFAVFDWQTVASGWPGQDLARIMFMGLRPDAHREHREELMQRYLDGLTSNGVQFDAAKLERQVQQGLLVTLFIGVFAIATSDMSILEQAARERGMVFTDRMFADLAIVMQDIRAHEVLD